MAEIDTITSSPVRSQLGKGQGLLRVYYSQEDRKPVYPRLGPFPNWRFLCPQCCVDPLQQWRTPRPLVPERPNIMCMPLYATSVMKDLPSATWPSSGAGAMASGTGPKLSAPNVSGYPQTPQHRFPYIFSLQLKHLITTHTDLAECLIIQPCR